MCVTGLKTLRLWSRLHVLPTKNPFHISHLFHEIIGYHPINLWNQCITPVSIVQYFPLPTGWDATRGLLRSFNWLVLCTVYCESVYMYKCFKCLAHKCMFINIWTQALQSGVTVYVCTDTDKLNVSETFFLWEPLVSYSAVAVFSWTLLNGHKSQWVLFYCFYL